MNRFVLRRNRATYTEKEGKEASKLLTQYAGQVPDNRTLIRLFSEAVLEAYGSGMQESGTGTSGTGG